MSNGYGDRTHCNYGHEYNKENTQYRKDGGRICRTCKLAKQAAARQRKRERIAKDPYYAEQVRERDRLSKQRQRAGDDLGHKNDEKRSAPHNALGIKPEAVDAWLKSGKLFEQMRTPCHNEPDKFIEYADPRHPDDPEEQAKTPFPSTAEAEAACEGCPLVQSGVCLEYALKQKEDFGIWGGKRIVGGRVYRGARKVVKGA